MGPTRRFAHTRWATGVLGMAVIAVMALGGSVLAQSSPPSPLGSASPSPLAAPGDPDGRMDCGPRWARDGRSRQRDQRRRGMGERRADRGQRRGMGERRADRGQRRWVGPDGFAAMPVRQAGRIATVTAVDGASITLTTADGWGRTLDVTGIPVMRGTEDVTGAGLQVSDRVRVVGRRAEDGTWQVTRLRILPATARGAVASVTPDGFTLATRDGTTVTVRVSEGTTWVSGCRQSGGLEGLRVGTWVVVRGRGATDGTIDATTVASAGARPSRPARGRVRHAPWVGVDGTPGASPTPAAAPA